MSVFVFWISLIRAANGRSGDKAFEKSRFDRGTRRWRRGTQCGDQTGLVSFELPQMKWVTEVTENCTEFTEPCLRNEFLGSGSPFPGGAMTMDSHRSKREKIRQICLMPG